MKKRVIIIALLVVGVAGFVWWLAQSRLAAGELVLHGNVDLRQVDLAFDNSQRISRVLAQEGDHVVRGQVLAELDTSRLVPQVAQMAAQVAAQEQVVQRLHNGSRPEEIAEARATLDSAKADAANARRQNDRLTGLAATSEGRGISQQDLDNARSALDVTTAKVEVAQKALDLMVIGPRKEDIAQAEAQLEADSAQLSYGQQELADSKLRSPSEAVVRTRIMEPGEMATPDKPVFSLAIISPKWVRAYVSEPDLGKVHPGMAASVEVDSFPDRKFEGWVGFISPVAEFTPKTVQTDDLRSSLVYEVRVFVNDPSDDLRLGMPATVDLNLNQTNGPTTTPSWAPESAISTSGAASTATSQGGS
jgi:HlyD family secretion protein